MSGFRSYLLAEGLSPTSVRHYLGSARRAEEWFDERGLSLGAADAETVATYVLFLPKTWASRNLLRATLRHYWAWCEHPKPPLKAIRVPPKPRMVCRALADDDTRLLAKAARHHGGREGLAVAFGLYHGMRREEIATVRWDAIRNGQITITGKGERVRTLPLHPVVAGLLAEHPQEGPYVFVGRGDRPHVTPMTVWHWVRNVADAAGLGLVACHVLRHVNLAWVVDQTGDLRSAQEWAGHASPSQTAGYSRATERRLRMVVEAIDFD